jgi:hypothetical protein
MSTDDTDEHYIYKDVLSLFNNANYRSRMLGAVVVVFHESQEV